MKAVPEDLKEYFREYVETYRPGEMLQFGDAPEIPPEAIEKLRNWFAVNDEQLRED